MVLLSISISSIPPAHCPFPRLSKSNRFLTISSCLFNTSSFSNKYTSKLSLQIRHYYSRSVGMVTKCEVKEEEEEEDSTGKDNNSRGGGGGGGGGLKVGSPIIMIAAPKVLKTAASVPCLRPNSGLVNPGDVGRIISRKPKDVWAVRLSIGTYLIDRIYFKPLELDG